MKPGSRYLQNYIKVGRQLSGVVIVDINDLAHGGLQAPVRRRYTILKTKKELCKKFNFENYEKDAYLKGRLTPISPYPAKA